MVTFQRKKDAIHNIIQTHNMLCGIDNMIQNIPHIQLECE